MKHRVPVFAKVLLAAGGMSAALLTAPPVSGQNQKESFTGFAINMNGGARKTAVIDFTIERWSTDAERDQLLAILARRRTATRQTRSC